jgi:PPOX class probable F420-dependent enzyme
MSVIPESHADILEKKGFAHVATIGPKGEPHSSPVWYEFDGEFFKFSNLKTRQKYKNLVRNPKVAISILDPDNPYRYLEIRGKVENIEDDINYEFIDRLAKKYMGVEKYPMHQPGDERVIIKIKPERVTKMG